MKEKNGLPRIEWAEHPRITPGIYPAYSAFARVCFGGHSEKIQNRAQRGAANISGNGSGRTGAHRVGEIAFHQEYFDIAWQESRSRTQTQRKALCRIRWYARFSNGKVGCYGSLSQQVTQSRTAFSTCCRNRWIQELIGKVRP